MGPDKDYQACQPHILARAFPPFLPVLSAVDVQIGHDDGVQGVLLGGPTQLGLEPRVVGGQLHARERPDRLVGELEGEERRAVNHVGDELVAHEDVLQKVPQDRVVPRAGPEARLEARPRVPVVVAIRFLD